jgi:ATP:cob(I)alamin adenosyltransferase
MISSGDQGKTFLLRGKAVSKADVVFDTLGDLDELNSFLGLAKCQLKNKTYKNLIEQIQKDIFQISAYLAGVKENDFVELIEKLDKSLLIFQKKVGSIHQFIIPGKSLESANLDVCRAISRRAERSVVKAFEKKKINKSVVIYLNHLSKFLFFFARMVEK